MTYDLAKELKDAGFPQGGSHFYWSNHTKPATRWDVNVLDDHEIPTGHLCADPTLSELIEGCGNGFIELRRRDHDWTAMAKSGKEYPHMDWVDGDGPTPEEAVARLWLALNPSPVEKK